MQSNLIRCLPARVQVAPQGLARVRKPLAVTQQRLPLQGAPPAEELCQQQLHEVGPPPQDRLQPTLHAQEAE